MLKRIAVSFVASLAALLVLAGSGLIFGQGSRVIMESSTDFTAGKVPFSIGGGLFGEDAKLNYNSTMHRLSIGSSEAPEATVHIAGDDYPQVVINGKAGDSTSGNIWIRFLPTDPFHYFDLSAKTVDGSDTKIMRLGGGGDVVPSRGAVLELAGNEAGGSAILSSGDSGGNVSLSPGLGDIKIGKPLVALGLGPVATMGAIGGSGPTNSAQSAWVRFIDSTGQAMWIPAFK